MQVQEFEVCIGRPDWQLINACAGAVLVLLLLLWGLKNALVWRLLSVFAIAGGVGVLVWGIMAGAMGEEPVIGSPAGLIGAGAGILAGGIVLLVISFLGKCSR